MPKYKITKTGYEIANNAYVDKRLVLTKDEMLTAEEDFILPEHYFAYCPDEYTFYFYDVNNPVNATTGKYQKINDLDIPLVLNVLYNGNSERDSEGIVDLSFLLQGLLVNGSEAEKDSGFAKIYIPYSTSEMLNTGLKDSEGILQEIVLLNQFLDFKSDMNNEIDAIYQLISGSETSEHGGSVFELLGELNAKINSESIVRSVADSEIYNLFNREKENFIRIITEGKAEIDKSITSEGRIRAAEDALLQNKIDTKQNKLIAGDFITIDPSTDTISADVGEGTLVLNVNNIEKGRFDANQATDSVIDITTPTKFSELTNDMYLVSEGYHDPQKQNILSPISPITIEGNTISLDDTNLVKGVRVNGKNVVENGIAIITFSDSERPPVVDVLTNNDSVVDPSNRIARLPAMAIGGNGGSVFGSNTAGLADGENAISLGGTASGQRSLATASNTASALDSIAFGTGNTANQQGSLTFGKYATLDANFVEKVGWGGASSNRENIRTLDTNGNQTIAGKYSGQGATFASNTAAYNSGYIFNTADITAGAASDNKRLLTGGVTLYGLTNPFRVVVGTSDSSRVLGDALVPTNPPTVEITFDKKQITDNLPAIFSGTTDPDNTLGKNGDIYIQYTA